MADTVRTLAALQALEGLSLTTPNGIRYEPIIQAIRDVLASIYDGLDLDVLTATAAELNAAADQTSRVVTVANATPYAVLAANSGKTHIIVDQTSTITLTLPTAAAGLEYEFIMGGVATEAQNWIFAAGVPYKGGLGFLDLDDPADTVNAGVYPNGSSNDNMTIVTPAAGTRVKLLCDGTNWFVNGIVISSTIPTFAN